MTMHRLLTTPAAGRPARWISLMLLALALAAGSAQAQTNFRPLERGEYTEKDDLVKVVEGLKVGGDYAFSLEKFYTPQAGAAGSFPDVGMFQNFRLNLDTATHRQAEMHLTLAAVSSRLNNTNPRQASSDTAPTVKGGGSLSDGSDMTLQAREAYLRWRFNPRSSIVMGKQEVSLADRKGKVFDGLAPAVTFDCLIKTWCFPFGVVKVGPASTDYVYHLALQYNAWDEETESGRDNLRVDVYRAMYKENNVPLGKQLVPAQYSQTTPATAHYSQMDFGGAVYYDASKFEYYGVRVDWASGPLKLEVDLTGAEGKRGYHDNIGTRLGDYSVNGFAFETDLSWKFGGHQFGVNYMAASGDEYKAQSGQTSFQRNLNGFFEITPGVYRGARLYFNGGDADVADGLGLGHSVNNTRMAALYYRHEPSAEDDFGYRGALVQLTRMYPVMDANGILQTSIGSEWDNMFIYPMSEAVAFQLELNLFSTGPAFAPADYDTPEGKSSSITQMVGRVVYHF